MTMRAHVKPCYLLIILSIEKQRKMPFRVGLEPLIFQAHSGRSIHSGTEVRKRSLVLVALKRSRFGDSSLFLSIQIINSSLLEINSSSRPCHHSYWIFVIKF